MSHRRTFSRRLEVEVLEDRLPPAASAAPSTCSGRRLAVPTIDVATSLAEGTATTETELRDSARAFADDILPSSLFVQIDGHSLQNLTSYRAQSPLYTYGPLPANNLLGVDA